MPKGKILTYSLILLSPFIVTIGVAVLMKCTEPELGAAPTYELSSKLPTRTFTRPKIDRILLPVGVPSSFKSYMDYRTITDKTTTQYAILKSGILRVNPYGLLETADNYIAVAMGSTFGPIGTKYIILLDTGNVLKVIKVEEKADKDTDPTHVYDAVNNSVVEFVVDPTTPYLSAYLHHGDLSYATGYLGNIISLRKVVEYGTVN